MTEEQALSDLHWAIGSPSLVVDPLAVVAQPLDGSVVDASHLVAFLDQRKSNRVGRYFEGLIEYWLLHVLQVDLIGHGIQLRDGKRTAGEIDFLFRDSEGALNHWEAAVKFFLHFPRPDASHYPGPNASDNFELKTEKLFEKQLKIGQSFYPEIAVRRAVVRGSIFYRPDSGEPAATPIRLAADHNRGRWIRESEILEIENATDRRGFICPKPFWLSPLASPVFSTMGDLGSELRSHFETKHHPVMVCLVNDETGLESDRLFVVADSWPVKPS